MLVLGGQLDHRPDRQGHPGGIQAIVGQCQGGGGCQHDQAEQAGSQDTDESIFRASIRRFRPGCFFHSRAKAQAIQDQQHEQEGDQAGLPTEARVLEDQEDAPAGQEGRQDQAKQPAQRLAAAASRESGRAGST